jgi:CDP-diacylglycerol pyrophosphatase
MRGMSARRFALAAALALGAVFVGGRALADRMALWRIVHEQCVPAAAKGEALPTPCLKVDAPNGSAVIKDRNGVAQLLEIPTARVTGIEDPQLLAPGEPNYFAAAWRNRDLMARYLKAPPPREAVAITINSEYSRSQDQLHLHVDCLRPDVAKALADYAPHFEAAWRPMTEALHGRKYWARRLDLDAVDPFRLVAEDPPAQAKIGQWSLAVIPLVFDGKPGFALLADPAELTAGGHAEDLQDHECLLAR